MTKNSERDSFLLIAEAKKIYGKSETTMRTIVRKLRQSKSKELKVVNDNGREKLLINRNYLDSIFSKKTDSEKTDSRKITSSDNLVEFLKGQIEIKDKQIENMQFLLAQAQDEKKQLLLMSSKSVDADVSAKEKPHEVAQDRSTVWVFLFVVIVLGALTYSVLTLI
jgi:hypothetical protein